MKEFTAKKMNLNPAPVFRAADRDGRAKITHSHYDDRDFFLIAEDKGPKDIDGMLVDAAADDIAHGIDSRSINSSLQQAMLANAGVYDHSVKDKDDE